jgi:hypothetical protein
VSESQIIMRATPTMIMYGAHVKPFG